VGIRAAEGSSEAVGELMVCVVLWLMNVVGYGGIDVGKRCSEMKGDASGIECIENRKSSAIQGCRQVYRQAQ
jgi:hypothetical protein